MNDQMNTLIKVTQVNDVVHRYVDKEIGAYPKSCKKGCDHCCYQSVNVVTWEEPKIFSYVYKSMKRKEIRKVASGIKKWFSFFNENTRDASRFNPLTFNEFYAIEHKIREARIPCPFLIDHKCSIYQARPITCRIHHVNVSPEVCKTNPHTTAPAYTLGISESGISKYDPTVFPVAWKPLAYLMAPTFVENVKSKPFMGILVDNRGRTVRDNSY